jgi:hypothetical protein
MELCHHRDFDHGIGPRDLPCRTGTPVSNPKQDKELRRIDVLMTQLMAERGTLPRRPRLLLKEGK